MNDDRDDRFTDAEDALALAMDMLPDKFGVFVTKEGGKYGCAFHRRSKAGDWEWLAGTKVTYPDAASAIRAGELQFTKAAILKAYPPVEPDPPPPPAPKKDEYFPPTPPPPSWAETVAVLEAEIGVTFPNTHWAVGRCLILWRLRPHYFHDVFRDERDAGLVASLAGCSVTYAKAIENELECIANGWPADDPRIRRRCDEFLEKFPEPLQGAPRAARGGKDNENSAEAQATRSEHSHAH